MATSRSEVGYDKILLQLAATEQSQDATGKRLDNGPAKRQPKLSLAGLSEH
jgi:hypothetical protein